MKPNTKKSPTAPAVYRPMPLPRVLQTKRNAAQAPINSSSPRKVAGRSGMKARCLSPAILHTAAIQLAESSATAATAATVATAPSQLDYTYFYRVQNAPPNALGEGFTATPVFAAVFSSTDSPKDIQATLQGFSQQSMGAFLYRFPRNTGTYTPGKDIPPQYLKGGISAGKEVTFDQPVPVNAIEVKVANTWKKVTDFIRKTGQ